MYQYYNNFGYLKGAHEVNKEYSSGNLVLAGIPAFFKHVFSHYYLVIKKTTA